MARPRAAQAGRPPIWARQRWPRQVRRKFCGSTWALLPKDVLPAEGCFAGKSNCRIRDFTTASTRHAKNLVRLGNAYSTQEGAFGDRASFVHSRQRLKGSV